MRFKIYDPETEQPLSYRSYSSEEDIHQTFIPLEGTIAGEVVKTDDPAWCLIFLMRGVTMKEGVMSAFFP